jgi:mono/diheme cytochrome c family protein
MSTLRRATALAAFLLGALALGAAPLAAQTRGDPARGRQVFERYCIQCHGDRGDGAGEVARWSQPKPRDFRQGVYKFSSTPYGSLPTTDDLDRVIQGGLYGTRMPPFAALSLRERRDVIAYLQTLSPRWRTEGPGKPVAIPAEPAPTREAVTQGRELFAATAAATALQAVNSWTIGGWPSRPPTSRSVAGSGPARPATSTSARWPGSTARRCPSPAMR